MHAKKVCALSRSTYSCFVFFLTNHPTLKAVKHNKKRAHWKKHFNVDLVEYPVDVQGLPWGDCDLDEHGFRVAAEGKLRLEVPLDQVNQVSILGRKELSLEFQHEEAFLAQGNEVLHVLHVRAPGDEGSLSAESLGATLLTLGGVDPQEFMRGAQAIGGVLL